MKKPKFYCDNCGTEVKNGTSACPHCGRFFSSVRCPACGFSGDDKLFFKGCPACGYSAPGSRGGVRKKQSKNKFLDVAVGSLPFWIYLFSAAAFIGVIVWLIFIL